ncbi:DUF4385 domain-containing protein [Commensalibacter papalotli (ex Botero et al. 2024)]|uniref:Cytoplasmic protein n=1 Tax=Commensalibacter papalotli (ex Botero et al. 2024) TaxID=2972766 RepID=A0ABN8WH38_9PROT|nr:DUF4385 domain-containing protein [Commensalibacter papalotli (ex Botero et al. 2024)]CAI3950202.1 unnamed protein product [Commensalibacter papalotli (ex Botero et al. 2024)]
MVKENFSEPPRKKSRVQSKSFDYSLDFEKINFKEHPELYRIGKGEQGVLSVEPYKSEILPYWRFASVEKAEESSNKIYDLFLEYIKNQDFVGADMARKFLQMGYTRARRYANHKGGKKYDGPVPTDKKGLSGSHGRQELPRTSEDKIKAEAARIFKQKWDDARANPDYLALKEVFLRRFTENKSECHDY